jgi:hypothetical protein
MYIGYNNMSFSCRLPLTDFRACVFEKMFSVKTWNNEHYEYHGQCDMGLTKDAKFANELGL